MLSDSRVIQAELLNRTGQAEQAFQQYAKALELGLPLLGRGSIGFMRAFAPATFKVRESKLEPRLSRPRIGNSLDRVGFVAGEPPRSFLAAAAGEQTEPFKKEQAAGSNTAPGGPALTTSMERCGYGVAFTQQGLHLSATNLTVNWLPSLTDWPIALSPVSVGVTVIAAVV